MPFDFFVGWLGICWLVWKFGIRRLFIRRGWFTDTEEPLSEDTLRRIRELDTEDVYDDTER